MTRYAVALGSNLGDRLANLRDGVAGLAELGVVEERSSVYETQPVGGPQQDSYLNAVVVVETVLGPPELLAAALDIEQASGRIRSERWGPRTLDVDIVAWDGDPYLAPGLEVPHPRAHQRAFVAIPLAEVWPEAILADGSTAAEAAGRSDISGISGFDGKLD